MPCDTFASLDMILCHLVPPPSTADDVLESFHPSHSHRDIVAWCVAIGEDAALTKDLV